MPWPSPDACVLSSGETIDPIRVIMGEGEAEDPQ